MSVYLARYKIERILDSLKKRQTWLSAESGVSKAVISRVMNGEGTTYETADAIANALGVSSAELRVESPGPRYEVQRTDSGVPVDLNSAVRMLTEIHTEDPQAWEWITGNLVMFTRALNRRGRGKKARDAG